MNLVWIFLGGGTGALVRFAISYYLAAKPFPFGTIVANVLASLLLGSLYAGYKENGSETTWFLLAVGFCGSLSTFSTFSLENFKLLNESNHFLLIMNIIGNLLLSFIAIAAGFWLTKIR